MRVIIPGLLLIGAAFSSSAQITFRSATQGFSVSVPVEPTEAIDTVDTEVGRVKRYLMTARTVEYSNNMYMVEILDLSMVNREVSFDELKRHLIARKTSGEIAFKVLKEGKINDPARPYVVEIILADEHGISLNYVRLFKTGSKFFSVETYQLKGFGKIGTRPSRLTTDYFASFSLN